MWKWSPVSARMKLTRSLAWRNSPIGPKPLGRSPRSATMRFRPIALNCARRSRTDSRVAPTQVKCEAASRPSSRMAWTAPIVPSCVLPPAP